MEIEVVKEDLSKIDCGGAYREAKAVITVDNTLPLFKQRQALIHEILSLHLDPLEFSNAMISELAFIIAESLELLE
jgi:hypothetical protein